MNGPLSRLQIALKSEALDEREEKLDERERDLAAREIEIEFRRILYETMAGEDRHS